MTDQPKDLFQYEMNTKNCRVKMRKTLFKLVDNSGGKVIAYLSRKSCHQNLPINLLLDWLAKRLLIYRYK